MKSTPQNDTHIWKKIFSSFSRKQVNQVNHQKRAYYILGKYLELGQLLESEHCLKNFALRSYVNLQKRHTLWKKIALDFLENSSQPSQPAKAHILYPWRISRAIAIAWKRTLFEKFSLEKWSQLPKTTHTFEIFFSRFSRESKSTKSTIKSAHTISLENL